MDSFTLNDSPQLFTVYAAMLDSGERGPSYVGAYFSSRTSADEWGKGRSWYGGNGITVEVPAVKVNGKVYALVSYSPIDLDLKQEATDEELRRRTLEGLTDEQVRVLGLKR